MKRLIKLISAVLCCAILLQISVTAYGTETEEVTEYVVPIVSNESSKTYVTLCEFEDRYFFGFEDISDFTRSTLEEDDNTITLHHGVREIKIEKATGSVTDTIVGIVEQGDMVEYGEIPVLEHNGSYYCETIPMLLCLGASCAINEDGKLEILMPSYTIYEAILPEYWTWYEDVGELYGGEDGVQNAITCALISDIFDFVDGEGIFANFDDHIENACYEIVDIDVMKYSSVQGEVIERNQKINSFFSGLDASKTVGAETLNYYVDFYLETQILESEAKWLKSYKAGDLEEASKLSKQINQQIYKQSKLKSNAQYADDIAGALMLAVDTAITSYSIMQYDDDSRNLFRRTINDEIIDKAGYNISCKNVTDQITKDLSSNAAIIGSTAADKVIDYVMDEASAKGVEGALTMFTSNAGLYTATMQIGGMVASFILTDVNQAFSADLNAIILGSFQCDVLELLRRYTINVGEQNDYLDEDSFENIKNLFMLYYRTAIAFNENYAVAIEAFDVDNGQMRAGLRRDIADCFAEYLYRITNCTMVPLVNDSIFEQAVITESWVSEAVIESLGKKLTQINQYSNNELSRTLVFTYNDDDLLTRISGTDYYDNAVSDEYVISCFYDGEGRYIRGELSYAPWTYDEYQYNEQGQLVFSHQYEGGNCTYKYDSSGMLIQTNSIGSAFETVTEYLYDTSDLPTGAYITYIDETGTVLGRGECVFKYDLTGRIISQNTWTTSESQNMSDSTEEMVITYDYKPFTVTTMTSADGRMYVSASIQDIMGSQIWSIFLDDMQLSTDDEGYLTQAFSYGTYYEFYYDGETDRYNISSEETEDWKQQYYNFIIDDKNDSEYSDEWDWVEYELIYLDGDDIPELWINYQIYAAGCRLVTTSNGKVNDELLGSGTLTYIDFQSIFHHSKGHQGVFWDTIYELDNGSLVTLANGQYNMYNWEYIWNDEAISEEEYFKKIDGYVEPTSSKSTALDQNVTYSYSEILTYLSNKG